MKQTLGVAGRPTPDGLLPLPFVKAGGGVLPPGMGAAETADRNLPARRARLCNVGAEAVACVVSQYG